MAGRKSLLPTGSPFGICGLLPSPTLPLGFKVPRVCARLWDGEEEGQLRTPDPADHKRALWCLGRGQLGIKGKEPSKQTGTAALHGGGAPV